MKGLPQEARAVSKFKPGDRVRHKRFPEAMVKILAVQHNHYKVQYADNDAPLSLTVAYVDRHFELPPAPSLPNSEDGYRNCNARFKVYGDTHDAARELARRIAYEWFGGDDWRFVRFDADAIQLTDGTIVVWEVDVEVMTTTQHPTTTNNQGQQ